MTTLDNFDRAERARDAIENSCMNNNDLETKITDLICDMRHLCDREEIPWKRVIKCAFNHYVNECLEEEQY